MNFYELRQRYSETTGKPTKKQKILAARICDFCGNRFYIDHDESPTILYTIKDIGGCEPWFDNERLFVTPKDGNEIEIDLYSLYSSHPDFVYCQTWAGGKDCAIQMIMDLVGQRSSRVGSLCDCMVAYRHEVVKKLIENGNFSLEELSLEVR